MSMHSNYIKINFLVYNFIKSIWRDALQKNGIIILELLFIYGGKNGKQRIAKIKKI